MTKTDTPKGVTQPKGTGRLADVIEPDEPTDLVQIRRVYQHEYAVERDDGDAVIGAIKVDPAPMAMVDDPSQHVRKLASALTQSTIERGMLLNVPRSVDYQSHRTRYRNLADEIRASAESWQDHLRADCYEERATEENLYEATTKTRDHYIVMSVSKTDAARTISEVNSSLASLPKIGRLFSKWRAHKLTEDERLDRLMIAILERRLESLAALVEHMHGISANPVPSADLAMLFAAHYRGDDVQQFPDFKSLIRRSPTPRDGQGDPIHETNERATLSAVADDKGREKQLKSLLSPRAIAHEQTGTNAFGLIGESQSRHTRTILVTAYPETMPDGFLDPLYKWGHPAVDITIATHFKKLEPTQAKIKIKQQVNSLDSKLNGSLGELFEERVLSQYVQSDEFQSDLEKTDFAVFECAMLITASAQPMLDDDGDVMTADEVLDRVVDEDLIPTIKDECGLDIQILTHDHKRGLQSTSPACENHFGENVTVRADGLGAMLPFQFKNLQESNGIRIGIHEYLQEPMRLNIYDRPNGFNGGVYGMIGSGKTISLSEIADALIDDHNVREQPLKVVLSTPLQDFEDFIAKHDAEHVVVGGDTSINPLEVRWAPEEKLAKRGYDEPWSTMLQRADAFLENYYAIEGLDDLGSKKGTWKRAIKVAQDRAGIERNDVESYKHDSATFADVIDVLDEAVNETPELLVRNAQLDDDKSIEGKLRTAREILNHDIEELEDDGRFYQFTQQSSISLRENDIIYLDLHRYESDKGAGGLIMQNLISDLYEQAKGYPGHVFFGIDEFHYMLRNPTSAQFFKQTHRHSRHWDLAMWLATQEFGDLFEEVTNDDGDTTISLSPSAKVIMHNQSMQLYHYTKEMTNKWGNDLKLSAKSQSYIEHAERGSETNEYSQGLLKVDDDEYPIRVEMSDDLNPRRFALRKFKPTDHGEDLKRYLEQYRTENGLDACDWGWL